MNKPAQEKLFNDWLQRHRGLIFKVIRAFSRDPHDAEDLFQEIALQIWNSIPGYEGRCAETTWTYRVAFFVATRWSQTERKRQQRKLDEQHRISFEPVPQADPRLEWLYTRIHELNDVDRTLTLLLFDGYEYKEIADILGLSVSHVGVKLNRIKKQLADRIASGGNDEV